MNRTDSAAGRQTLRCMPRSVAALPPLCGEHHVSNLQQPRAALPNPAATLRFRQSR